MIDLGAAEPQRPERYRPPEAPADPIEAFAGAMAAYGLKPGAIEPSGRLVRFDVDKRGDKAAWYVFFGGDVPAGAFGNWKSGDRQNWCSKERGAMSDAESAKYRAMVEDARRQREAETARLQQAARKTAAEIWDRAEPAPADHPYLTKKGISGHGLRVSRGDLVTPVQDETGALWNLQFIKPDGSKKFLFGGRKEGCSFTIQGAPDFYLCEGFATGASIHAATGGTVICAFDSGNMPKVAKAFRGLCPTEKIVICGDNDRFTAGNPGLAKASEAAKSISAAVAVPDFTGLPGGNDPNARLTDFNDLAGLVGADEVKKQVKAQGKRQGLAPLSSAGSRVKGRLIARPRPLDFLFRYNEQGLIPKGVVGVLAATGGTGKTFFLLSLAMAGAAGGNFGPINAPRPINTLVVCGEDTQDELDRRLWDIGKGQFPDLLHAASVYGEIGPLMRLDGSTPTLADGYYWLEETIKLHAGLELLIIDPKSRFYGLDENNNDHATQWIQSIETLSKRYDLTVLFSAHTGKDNAGRMGQNMNRGASAIVDGCRWQGGLVRMEKGQAEQLGIEDFRSYIVFDAPKSNYAADLPGQMIFRRGENGVLEYNEPWHNRTEQMAAALLEIIKQDPAQYTKKDLIKDKAGKDVAEDMKVQFSGFKRGRDMDAAVRVLMQSGRLFETDSNDGGRGRNRLILSTTPF